MYQNTSLNVLLVDLTEPKWPWGVRKSLDSVRKVSKLAFAVWCVTDVKLCHEMSFAKLPYDQ